MAANSPLLESNIVDGHVKLLSWKCPECSPFNSPDMPRSRRQEPDSGQVERQVELQCQDLSYEKEDWLPTLNPWPRKHSEMIHVDSRVHVSVVLLLTQFSEST